MAHAEARAVLEHALGTAHVHVVALALVAPQAADEAQVDHRRGLLGPNDVLEAALAQVGDVNANPSGAERQRVQSTPHTSRVPRSRRVSSRPSGLEIPEIRTFSTARTTFRRGARGRCEAP